MRSLLAVLFILLFAVLAPSASRASEFESQVPGPALHAAPELTVQEISVSVT